MSKYRIVKKVWNNDVERFLIQKNIGGSPDVKWFNVYDEEGAPTTIEKAKAAIEKIKIKELAVPKVVSEDVVHSDEW